MLYVIQAQIVIPSGQWRASFGLPTFLLDSDIQAIRDSAHARDIATRMLSALAPEGSEVHVSVAQRD